MPEVRKGESSQDYVSRCIPRVMAEGKTKNKPQASVMECCVKREGEPFLLKKDKMQ